MLEDIVSRLLDCPKNEAKLLLQLWNFKANLSGKNIRSSDIPASQEGVYLLYNPLFESATNEIGAKSAKPSKILTAYFWGFFFCISWRSTGNKAFYRVFLIFHLSIKFSKCLFCLQMADKIGRRISNRKGYIAWEPSCDFVSPDAF